MKKPACTKKGTERSAVVTEHLNMALALIFDALNFDIHEYFYIHLRSESF